MQLSLPFGHHAGASAQDPVGEKLRAVLAAARRTPFYAQRLHGMGGISPREILAAMPPVAFRMFADHRDRFTNPAARSRGSRLGGIQALPAGWRTRLGFPVEALAGPAGELARLGDARTARRLIVYTSLGDRLLHPDLRERLWGSYELPVFEQLRGLDGEMLASECDAHEGLHLAPNTAIFEVLDGELVVTSLAGLRHPVLRLRTGLTGALETGACPCGSVSPRFLTTPSAQPLRKPPLVERGRQDRLLTRAAR